MEPMTNDDLEMARYRLAQKMRAYMQKNGLKSGELAERAGLTSAHVSMIANRNVNPTFETLAKLDKAMGGEIFNFKLE